MNFLSHRGKRITLSCRKCNSKSSNEQASLFQIFKASFMIFLNKPKYFEKLFYYPSYSNHFCCSCCSHASVIVMITVIVIIPNITSPIFPNFLCSRLAYHKTKVNKKYVKKHTSSLWNRRKWKISDYPTEFNSSRGKICAFPISFPCLRKQKCISL